MNKIASRRGMGKVRRVQASVCVKPFSRHLRRILYAFTKNSLRKSFATNFMEIHPDRPWILMDLMGHLNPSTLHRYVKHSRAYYAQAIDDIVGAMVTEITDMQGAR
jgi:hypothetical protein